jgi:hypothetical protein
MTVFTPDSSKIEHERRWFSRTRPSRAGYSNDRLLRLGRKRKRDKA